MYSNIELYIFRPVSDWLTLIPWQESKKAETEAKRITSEMLRIEEIFLTDGIPNDKQTLIMPRENQHGKAKVIIMVWTEATNATVVIIPIPHFSKMIRSY